MRIESIFVRAALLVIVASVGFSSKATAEFEIDFQSEIIGWIVTSEGDQREQEAGLRLVPGLKISNQVTESLGVDCELMANAFGTYSAVDDEEAESDFESKAYRLWIRGFTDELEIRLGLQEISFGPGRILRSLRWFDQKDSRDPTGLTDGVKALLFRYYFEDNSNFWLWSLHQNEDPMGISPFTTWENSYESGGRYQFSLGAGEIGFSYHQRKVDLNDLIGNGLLNIKELNEQRIGVDIAWDLDIGIWLESSFLRLEENPYVPENQLFLTIGADYTFDIGNGLNSLAEVMTVRIESESNSQYNDTYTTMALSGTYPLNLLDQIQVMVFHGDKNSITSLQFDWKRIYDSFIFDCILFYTETSTETTQSSSQSFSYLNAENERGLRLLGQYNF